MSSTSAYKHETSLDHEEDRISNLPSSLIGHILSLVPTKDAVATTVLSKRWKNHWTLITRLEFNDDKMPTIKNVAQAIQLSFTNFVYRVLQRCTSSELSKFHLVCWRGYDASHVVTWICTVLEHSVQDLRISVPMKRPALLPWNLFTSKTLVELRLCRNFVLTVPTLVSLPCLKVLNLEYVKLIDEDTISKLIGGCPVLEKLSIRECIGKEVKVVNISSLALERLDLISLPYDFGDKVSRVEIVLETPKLSYFYLEDDHVAQGYQLKNVNCLNQVIICVKFEESGRTSFQGLLEAISKVAVLEFKSCTMEAIVKCKSQLPVFQNVSELRLGSANRNVTWQLLPMLLKKMQRLTTLTIAEVLSNDEKNEVGWEHWNPREDVPRCLFNSLRKIEIKKFKGKDYERATVEYFLNNANVLEKLIIHYDILEMPRASRACEVMVL